MEFFKVICKAPSDSWEKVKKVSRIVTTKKFFGLLSSSKVVTDPGKVPGPGKEEICIVTEVIEYPDMTGYVLAGYPYGSYDSRHFIRLDEFTESQKEIAEKAATVFN